MLEFNGVVLLVVGIYLFLKNADSPIGVWFIVFAAVFIIIGMTTAVRAHDHDRPDLDAWYQGLMQPDSRKASGRTITSLDATAFITHGMTPTTAATVPPRLPIACNA